MFYAHVKQVCKEHKTSPSAVLLGIGMSKSNATEWKKGQSPKLSTVIKMAEYLGIDPAELIPKGEDDGQ